MLFLYVIPMILCLLFLYYIIDDPEFEVTNAGVLVFGVMAFVPIANIIAVFAYIIFWLTVSEWANKPFTKPSFLSKSRS